MSDYRTISSVSEGLYKEKGSKFIAVAFPVETESEVRNRLSELRQTYNDARHHCYAYSIGLSPAYKRNSDDGEPSNSAGPPIEGQIDAFDLANVLIVVIRYFGGTKLGVGGLINAYRTAARDALEQAEIVKVELKNTYELIFNYNQTAQLKRVLEMNRCDVTEEKFDAKCFVRFRVPVSFDKKLQGDMERLGLELKPTDNK